MKCPLCSDGADYTLKEMDKHLTDDHDMNLNDREQFGGDFSALVEEQMKKEGIEIK